MDQKRIEQQSRLWGVLMIARGIIELGFYLVISRSVVGVETVTLAPVYVLIGVMAFFLRGAPLFLAIGVALVGAALPNVLLAGIPGILTLLDVAVAVLLFALLFLPMRAVPDQSEGRRRMDAAFPWIALGTGFAGVLLIIVGLVAASEALLTAGLNAGIIGLGIGVAAVVSIEQQRLFSGLGTLLGLAAFLLWVLTSV
ncbi:MAG: hypothetical protein GYB64_20675 [Chloroflexi bacterium]|nr:hypothetical protein [Chloroflexota bacterium]